MKKFSLFLIIGILFISCGQKEEGAVWKGTITEKNGVNIVHNPKEPMYEGEIIIFKEELSIGIPEGDENYMFSRLNDIEVDSDGNIFALDGQECVVKVYDKNGNFLRKFGRKGQGPGEFQNSHTILISPKNGILVYAPREMHIVEFSKSGDFLGNIRLYHLFDDLIQDSEQNIIGKNAVYKGKTKDNIPISDRQLLKCSPPYKDFQIITSFDSQKSLQPCPNIKFAQYTNDSIVWALTSKYVLHVWDKNEKEIRQIIKDCDPLPMTDEYKQSIIRMTKSMLGTSKGVKFKDNFDPIVTIHSDENGYLYVRAKEKGKNKKPLFDVFDPEGRFLGKTSVPYLPIVFKFGKLYTIFSDENGYKSIKRYKMIWNY